VTQIGRIKPRPLEAKHEVARAVAEAGYTLEPLDGARWLAALPELHQKADEIFSDSFAYTPVSYEQFAAGYGASVARRLCARTSLLARGPDGDLAGFVLVYPHYGPLAVQGSALGRVPVSDLSYDVHDSILAAGGGSVAVAKTVGVCPKHRGRGLMDALGAAAIDRGVGRYDRWVGAMIRADNPSRRFGAAHMDVERTYALYRQTLSTPNGAEDAGH
jgi:GNAT superfamily N-acetyltransferase